MEGDVAKMGEVHVHVAVHVTEAWSVKAGDRIVLMVPADTTQEQAHQVLTAMREQWPDVEFAALSDNITLVVERADKPRTLSEMRAGLTAEEVAESVLRAKCPDGGTCHHGCTPCWRVSNCGPLSGVYEGNRWPSNLRPTS